MATTNTIPDHYVVQFDTNWKLAVQQVLERLRRVVTVRTGCSGRAVTHNRIEKEEMEEQTERLQTTTGTELTTEKRWVFPRPHQKTTYIDEWDADLLGQTVLPTGDAVRVHAAASARKMDKIIIDGLDGNNYTGSGNEEAITATAFASGQKIAITFDYDSAVSQSLSLDKLIATKSKFGTDEVYGQDQRYMGDVMVISVNQNMLDNLLRATQLTSADYASVKALVEGEISHFMGFEFVRTEQLPANAAATGYLSYAWVKSHVKLDVWADFKSRMSIRDDLSEAIQIRSKLMAGSTYDQNEAVVQIDCKTLASA